MSDAHPPSPLLELTPRQRRLRRIVVILLVAIGVLCAFGVLHPFFRLRHSGPLTETVRKALAVKGIFILSYWSIVFLLAVVLILVAWLDIREIRAKLAREQVDILRRMAEQARKEREGGRSGGTNAAGEPGKADDTDSADDDG
jgi:hypothetical protein